MFQAWFSILNMSVKTYRPHSSAVDYFRRLFDFFPMTDPNRPYRVGFLVFPRFSMIALSSVMEPLREANWVSGKRLYDWVLITPNDPCVTSSNNTKLMIDNDLRAVRGCDMLIVCASFDLEHHATPRTLSALRKAARHGVVLGSIDTGSYLLARAGLLDGAAATIHWENATGFAEEFPEVSLTHEIFTIDGNRWTCSGGSSGIDMMLHLIRQQHGVELSVGVAECAILGGIRSGQAAQRLSTRERLNTTNSSLIAAIQVMEANLTSRLSVPEIATLTGVSQRRLERVFQQNLGITPTAHYLQLRLHRARLLLHQTSLQVGTIAASCGFTSQAQFSRAYCNQFAVPPSRDRITVPGG
jgi:transcriptional regulator GlxA family with amidase domain